jgi:hypothetical protein
MSRVHDALEHWGLINYAVNPETLSLLTTTATEVPDLKPHQQVLQLEHDEIVTQAFRRRLKTTTTSSLSLHSDTFPRTSASTTTTTTTSTTSHNNNNNNRNIININVNYTNAEVLSSVASLSSSIHIPLINVSCV